MLNKHTLWLNQLNKAIDNKLLNEDNSPLKVNRELYEFIVFKYKSEKFRGIKLVVK